jgi:uncharacterized protein YndB with AHSA1/START domain
MTTPGPTDRLLEAAVHVDAPPERVWDMVADVTRMGEWSPECYRCRWIGSVHRPEVGARFVGVNRRGLVRWPTRNRVEQAERGKVFAFATADSGAVWAYRFEPEGDGTRLIEVREMRSAPPARAKLFVRFLLGGTEAHDDVLRRGMEQSLERIKAAAEATG